MDQSRNDPVVKPQSKGGAKQKKRKSPSYLIKPVPNEGPLYVSEGPMPIGAQIKSLFRQVLLSPEDQARLVSTVLEDLESSLCRAFPNCEPYVFGSMATGLCLLGSDMDIFLDIGIYDESTSPHINKWELKPVVDLCTRALRQNSNVENIVPIPHARVPIVKFVHRRTKIAGDISFQSPMGVSNSRLLKFFLSLHPRFYEVMVVIKFWAKKQDICSCSFLSSYGWTILLISYLQTLKLPNGRPLIPSVYDLQRWPDNPDLWTTVNNWRVDFQTIINHVTLPNDWRFSHMGLLEGFFTYYSNFGFEENIVSPFLGQPIPWSSLSDPQANTFPPEFPALRNHFKEFFADKVASHPQVSIQDPFEHNFLIGISCRDARFLKLVRYLTAAARVCQQQGRNAERSTILQDLLTLKVVTYIGKINIKLQPLSGLERHEVITLAVRTLEDIFREIMKFTLSSQSDASSSSGETSSKVAKTDEAQNVHQCDEEEGFEKTYNCVSSYPLCYSRKKVRKDIPLCFPETGFDFEKKVSDEVVKLKLHPQRAEFSCTVSVPKNDLCLRLVFEESIKEKACKASSTIVLFLESTLPGWLNSFMLERHQTPVVASESKQTDKLPSPPNESEQIEVLPSPSNESEQIEKLPSQSNGNEETEKLPSPSEANDAI